MTTDAARLIAEEIPAITKAINSLAKEIERLDAAVTVEIRVIREQLNTIRQILMEGNGNPPLTSRMMLVEDKLKTMTGERIEVRQSNRAIILAVVSALMALASQLVELIASHIVSKPPTRTSAIESSQSSAHLDHRVPPRLE